MKAHRGSTGVALLFLKPRCYMGVGGLRHTPAALALGKRPHIHCAGGLVSLGAGLDWC